MASENNNVIIAFSAIFIIAFTNEPWARGGRRDGTASLVGDVSEKSAADADAGDVQKKEQE